MPMRAAAPLRRRLILLILLPLLGGCAAIIRQDPPPPAVARDLPVLGIPNARFWPDAAPDALLLEAQQVAAREAAARGAAQ
ncbi:MAG: hypothetical protein K2X49_19445, partial [Acetobacteraceae bacterium]|nr:hypothetical protein [Acetobacteraceae bacterium]